jgi:hypothetical protein
MDPYAQWATVPAHGEVLLCLYDYEDDEIDDPPTLLRIPVVAWRIRPCSRDHKAGHQEDTPIPILPLSCEIPRQYKEWTGLMRSVVMAILMPDGMVYSDDGTEWFASVDEFRERWLKFFRYRAEARQAEHRRLEAEAAKA